MSRCALNLTRLHQLTVLRAIFAAMARDAIWTLTHVRIYCIDPEGGNLRYEQELASYHCTTAFFRNTILTVFVAVHHPVLSCCRTPLGQPVAIV
jgi:hypothetical protein